MIRIFVVTLLFGFFVGFVTRGHAAESGESVTRTPRTEPAPQKTFSLSAVAEYGPSTLSDAKASDLDTRGNFREGLAVFSRTFARDGAIGAGFGFFASDLTGTNRNGTSAVGLSSYARSLSGEVARIIARYRLSEHFEAGISADLLFGSNLGMSSDVFETPRHTAWLGGAELLYGFNLGGVRLKTGAKYFASLGLPERNLRAVQGVVEAGVFAF